MKCLLLLAVVFGVAKAFEPTAADDRCIMCGDPVVRTFAGTYRMLTTINKTLITDLPSYTHTPDEQNRCKFQIDCVTAYSNYWDVPQNGPLWVDWCGIGFWPHKNPDKLFRNWLIGQNLDCVGERGQGYSGGMIRVDLPRTFPIDAADVATFPDKDVLQPEPVTCKVYSLERNGNQIEFRSNPECDCGWAVDWIPCERNTCIIIYSQASRHAEREGIVDGMCGPMKTKADDWVCCFGGGPCTDFDEISKSCQHGDNDGQSYIGSTKLHNMCGIPGGPITC